jgi:hypothetical protein
MTAAWDGTIEALCAWPEADLADRSRFLHAFRAGLVEALAQVPASRSWPLRLSGPPSNGRTQPDALIFAGRFLLALTFREAELPVQAHLDLVMAQARDLRRRQRSTQALTAIPVLALTRAVIRPVLYDGVCVVSPDKLPGLFKMFGLESAKPLADLEPAFADGQDEVVFEVEVDAWTDHLLAGRFADAKLLANHLRDEGFDLYLTWDAAACGEYLAERYGVPSLPGFPVLEWTEGLVWDGQSWTGPDAEEFRKTLCGSRDGVIALVKPTPPFDATYKALAAAGAVPLTRGPLELPA